MSDTEELIPSNKRFSLDYFLLSFAFVKLLMHLLTNSNYALHRDAYLYLAQGEHLGWGYMEVPPFIAIIAKLALSLGGSVEIIRFFPTLIGAISVYLLGQMTKEMGGKRWAQAFAMLAFILSMAYMRCNGLFQPVSFNQFWWLVTAFLVVRLIQTEDARIWYWIGLVAGVGMMTKYSIAFFYAALLPALLLSAQRKWLATRYPYIALGITFIIFLPNLLWQWHHNWPVVAHMLDLSKTQLVNVDTKGFLTAQLLFHSAGTLIWLAGLFYLLFAAKIRPYRPLAFAYIFVILLLLYLSGKSYYVIGAYPMLMAAGGVAWEQWLSKVWRPLSYAFIVFLVLIALPLIPYGLPVFPAEKMSAYSQMMLERYHLEGPLVWEDGRLHELPQDYADMRGWEQTVANVSKVYHSLSPEDQANCMIYGGSYGHVGAVNYYRKKYNLPEAYSFNSSFMIWAPDTANFNQQIIIDDRFQKESRYFEIMEFKDSITDPYARDPGYIWHVRQPRGDVKEAWKRIAREEKAEFNF